MPTVKSHAFNIARDLRSSEIHKATFARAFLKMLSQYPLYFEPGVFISDPKIEDKYMKKMSNVEAIFAGCLDITTREFDELCEWLEQLWIGSGEDPYQGCSSILGTYSSYQYESRNHLHPLNMIREIFTTIRKIMACGGEDRTTKIGEFNKFMLNLAVVGRAGALDAYYPRKKQVMPRIPAADEYYCIPLGDPKFDLFQFLMRGPHTIFNYKNDKNNPIERVCYILQNRYGIRTVSDLHHSRYQYVVVRLHKWGNLTAAQRDEEFKLRFPEPVTEIDLLCVPF